jgi:hypothetical protein
MVAASRFSGSSGGRCGRWSTSTRWASRRSGWIATCWRRTGGTRTAAINGAFVALVDALTRKADCLPPIGRLLRDSVAAVSVGVVEGVELLDLDYREDRDAAVDFNVIMTGRGQFVEVQGAGEEATFTREQLSRLLDLATQGIGEITQRQRQALALDGDIPNCWGLPEASQTGPASAAAEAAEAV